MEFINLEYSTEVKKQLESYKKLQKALEMLLEVEQETGIKFEISHKVSECKCDYINHLMSGEKILAYKCEYCVKNDAKSI